MGGEKPRDNGKGKGKGKAMAGAPVGTGPTRVQVRKEEVRQRHGPGLGWVEDHGVVVSRLGRLGLETVLGRRDL